MKTSNDSAEKIEFSNDGIRGIAGQWPFNKQGMYKIGHVLTEFVLGKGNTNPLIVLGRDTRPSGQIFGEILTDCFFAGGIHVEDLGIAPTPVVSYAAKKRSAELGIVISASHNAPSYNGIKLLNSDGLRLPDKDEEQVRMLLNSHDIGDGKNIPSRNSSKPADGRGVIDEYINRHAEILGSECLSGLKLTIDCSNGATSLTAPQLLTSLGATAITTNTDLTGIHINQNCGSEYARRNPVDFILRVRHNDADYGLAFDGDGDRIVIVDRNGNFYNGDDLLYLLAIQSKTENQLPGNTIVTTELSNSALRLSLQNAGVDTIYTKNGDKHLENLMWSNGFLLGGEQVGNIIINDGIHSAADPLYAFALIFKKLNLCNDSLAERTKSLKKYPQVSASVYLHRKVPLDEIGHLRADMETSGQLRGHLRVKYWYSSTEDGLFNVMMEGVESEALEAIRRQAYLFCQKVLLLNDSPDKEINILDVSSRKRL